MGVLKINFVSFKFRSQRAVVEGFLSAGGEVFKFYEWPFLTDYNGVAGAEIFGFLELLPDLGGFEWEIGGETQLAAGLDDMECFGAARLVGNDDIGIARGGECGMELGGGGRRFVNEVAEHNIAHTESNGG
jgi:hypothetical protein